MSDDEIDRSKLTFSQAEGLEPIPGPLKLGEFSSELRTLLWRMVYEELKSASRYPSMGGSQYLEEPWDDICYDKHVKIDGLAADEYTNNFETNSNKIKELVNTGQWNHVLDFLQFVMRHRRCPYGFPEKVQWVLNRAQAAYTVLPDKRTIAPAATPEEGEAIARAAKVLIETGFDGALAHLKKAAEALNNGDPAGSVRESIHAVESVARRLNEDASTTLKPALDTLAKNARLHPALKAGFEKIYGYTNDENGIRHALHEGDSNVDQNDAVFMIGACASFVTYLIGKARRGGLINE